MEGTSREVATRLVGRLAAGDARAADELFPLVYAELHEIARRALDGQAAVHTLQPTALVNEAYLRLAGGSEWSGRAHFLGVAAKAMRSVLIDHARRKAALRRGGSAERQPLDLVVEGLEQEAPDLVALDAALERLARQDQELARLVELRFFGGLSMDEVASALGLSVATAQRRWTVARLWLQRDMRA